jgi:hypothetical protein
MRKWARATVVLIGAAWPCVSVLAADVQPVALDLAYLKTGQKPATFKSWGDRLDYIHAGMADHLTAKVTGVDSYFAVPGEEAIKPPDAKFRFALYVELDENGSEFALAPDVDIEVALPNLETRWRVFITRKGVGELPGIEPTERDNDLYVGVGGRNERFHIRTDAGVKARWLPEAFARVTWCPVWHAGGLRVFPSQRLYWESEDGFGEVTQLAAQRWLGRRQRHVLHAVSAAKYAETTYGVYLEQTLVYGLMTSMIDERRRGQSAHRKNTRELIALRYSGFGSTEPLPAVEASGIQRHRFAIVYRRPLYKKWMFLELMPEVEFDREDDWEPNVKFRVGFDALFWEVGD